MEKSKNKNRETTRGLEARKRENRRTITRELKKETKVEKFETVDGSQGW